MADLVTSDEVIARVMACASNLGFDECRLHFWDFETSVDPKELGDRPVWGIAALAAAESKHCREATEIFNSCLEIGGIGTEVQSHLYWHYACLMTASNQFERALIAISRCLDIADHQEIVVAASQLHSRLLVRLGRSAPSLTLSDDGHRSVKHWSEDIILFHERTKGITPTHRDGIPTSSILWHAAFHEWTLGGDLGVIGRICRTNKECDGPYFRLCLFLASHCSIYTGKPSWIQSPDAIKRSYRRRDGLEYVNIDEFTRCVDRFWAMVTSGCSNRSLDFLDQIEETLWKLPTPDTHLLLLIALSFTFKKAGRAHLAADFLARYSQASLTLSGGRTEDLYHRAPLLRDEIPYVETTSSMTRLTVHLSVAAVQTVVASKIRHLSHTQERQRDAREDLARAVLEVLDGYGKRNRGVVAKILQLGESVSELLPDGVASIARSSNTSGLAIPFEKVESIIRSSVANIDRIEPLPIACGSVSQVHRAQLRDGEQVVVKVRYPRLVQNMNEELKELKKILWILKPFFPKYDLPQVASRRYALLSSECSVSAERLNHQLMRKIFDPIQGIYIPQIFEGGQDDCLVMEFVEGESFEEISQNASQLERDQYGENIALSVLLPMACGYNRYDVHPSNFLFKEGRVIALDFGGVERFADDSLQWFHWTTKAAARSHDLDHIVGFMERLGAPNAKEMALKFRDIYLAPIWQGKFTFDTDFSRKVIREQIFGVEDKKVVVPASMLNAVRFYWSLYSMLGGLRCTVDFESIFARIEASGLDSNRDVHRYKCLRS